jgi:hypothetical protein
VRVQLWVPHWQVKCVLDYSIGKVASVFTRVSILIIALSILCGAILTSLLAPEEAQAVPAFARKYNTNCMDYHTAPIAQQLHGLAPGPPAKFRRAREVAPSVAEPQVEFPGLAVSQPGSEAPPTRSACSESTGPVIVGRVLYRGLVPAPPQK